MACPRCLHYCLQGDYRAIFFPCPIMRPNKVTIFLLQAVCKWMYWPDVKASRRVSVWVEEARITPCSSHLQCAFIQESISMHPEKRKANEREKGINQAVKIPGRCLEWKSSSGFPVFVGGP